MMLDHLRHALISLSAGLFLFSCSDEPDMSGYEMKFDISAVSRSGVTTASNIIEKPFSVFGDMIPTAAADDPSARTIIYNNTPVTYINSAWSTQDPQYWYRNHNHSFVAIHPASVVSATDADTRYSNSQLSFTYTLPSDYLQTADILSATHRRQYTGIKSRPDAVYLHFGHMMSLINIAPKFDDDFMYEDEYIEFYKLELSGFNTGALFTIRPASLLTGNQTDDNERNVSGQSGTGSLTVEFKTPKKVSNNKEYINLFEENDAIIMLPQNLASEAKLTLWYKIFYNDPSLNNDVEMKEVNLPLTGQIWESGKRYTYKFTIERRGPHIDKPTITNWDVVNVNEINAR